MQLVSNNSVTVSNNYFTEITVHPQSVNTTLNSTVIFTCEATSAGFKISFRVNDTFAGGLDIINKGFIQQPESTLSDGRKIRLLLAKALINNNNTNILCRAINIHNNSKIVHVHSDVAVLRIQGELML